MDTVNDILKTFKGPFHPYVYGMVEMARELILEVMPDVIEQVDPSANLIAYGTDRTYKGLICGIVVNRMSINLMFARGAELVDYDRLLLGSGKHARHILIQDQGDLLFPGVMHLLEAALSLHRGGVMEPARLLERLDEIGASLERSGHALGLLGLGSVGLELSRLDAWSDLDFFVIVETGYKQHYLQDLAWLMDIAPAAYYFQNTPDGFKFLFADGAFCEFAVFEPGEMQTAVYSPGRLVWKRSDIQEDWSQPLRLPAQFTSVKHDPAWLLGEALTNLYVGLGRDRRGEKLTACRFIQNYAVERVLDWIEQEQAASGALRDVFDINRRFEQRFPEAAMALPAMMQGYDRNRESALAVLAFLEEHCEVPPAMSAAIRALAG